MSAPASIALPTPMPAEARRSDRLHLAIPVELTLRESDGELLKECTRTTCLNKHGASLRTRRQYPARSELDVRILHLGRARQARVVWSIPDRSDGLGYETAIELADAENFWSVKFPPGN